jgi:hypothetical protein
VRKAALLLLISLVAAITIVGTASAASAQTSPTLTLDPYCPVLGGEQWYGALGSVRGLPPNSTFVGTVDLGSVSGSATYTADANGSYGSIGFATADKVEVATFTVQWSGGELFLTLERPCQPPASPTTKAQCKHGGFATYGFKNQGACVSFVARKRTAA